jgi:NitT/TauT family transport system ATP-binding protein
MARSEGAAMISGAQKGIPATPYKLEIQDLSKEYEITVLQNLNLAVRPSEFLCLLGPNGCGKTTLLRILAGLEQPDAGTVLLDGEPVDLMVPHPHKIGVVFQEPRLLPWKSILDNITLCLKPLGLAGAAATSRARQYLELVGLHGFDSYYPSRLSGGMQQRAAIGRALAVEPEILLMDEPFSALDPESRRIMQEEVVKIWRATNKTILFVTHSIEEALNIGTRVILLTARPAQVHTICELDEWTDRSALASRLLVALSEQVRHQRELDRQRAATIG